MYSLFKIYLSALLCIWIIPIYSNPTQKLITAIEQNNSTQAKEAIQEGADINAHGQTSSNDLAATDWTPLMKSIGQLNSSIIISQSYINTVKNLSTYLFFGSTALAGIASVYKRSWYPVLLTGALATLPYLLTSPVIKALDAPAINNQYKITTSLLRNPAIQKDYVGRNTTSASTIAQRGYDLLHSSDICPPSPAYTPEAKYSNMLGSIKSQLPTIAANPLMPKYQPRAALHFSQANEFKKINDSDKLPIIFDVNYDITFGGLERFHPFDTKKYGKVSAYLLKNVFQNSNRFHTPISVSDADLRLVHTSSYLDSIKNSFTLGLIADMPILGLLPNRLVQKALLDPVKLATGGTILGARLALEYGWAINLSGGYHHAKCNKPVAGGFCIINDICIAARKVLLAHPDYRILIVDLDAHQGNGHEEVARDEKNIAIFDIYNGKTWPGDFACQERINFNFPVDGRKIKGNAYLNLLSRELPKAIDQVKPNLIIYNAGTDVYCKDPIGGMSLTKKDIIDRDEVVFMQAVARNIPILMVLSGGYHAESHSIISESVENLWNSVLHHTIL